MKIFDISTGWFLRLDPGEELIACLKSFGSSNEVTFASITSGVGMVSEAEMGFFCVPKDDYDRFHLTDGDYDLSVLSGNISVLNGQCWPHVHMVVNKIGGTTYSGHVLSAICHITMEIFVTNHSESPVVRCKSKGLPASRLDVV